jgi:hypothetical protein
MHILFFPRRLAIQGKGVKLCCSGSEHCYYYSTNEAVPRLLSEEPCRHHLAKPKRTKEGLLLAATVVQGPWS